YLTSHGRQYVNIGKTHFHSGGSYHFTHQEYEGFMKHPDIGCFFRDRKTGRIGAEKRFEKIGLKTEESHDDKVLQASLSWLENHASEDNWHLYIGFLDPHFPFYVKKENWDYFEERIQEIPDALKPPFPSLNEPLSWLRTYFKCENLTEDTIRKLLIGYHCAIAELDERIGILLDKLDALQLTEKIVFCYTSDHGEQLGYHGLWWKCCMFEESAHIPMIIRVPGQPPRRIADPVNLVDWFPTVCDYMGLPIPEHLDGQSLRLYIETGANPQHQDFSFSEYQAHGIPHGMFMIRWKQYKYVYYCYDKPQLFDLAADPAENHNLYCCTPENPAIMEIAEECHKRLLSVCNPYEVDTRAKKFQKRTKQELGIVEYDTDMGNCPVPHPEATV
ncbi:MAG: sulfatase-like hydrolase/transferase, partial [Lachnospiraceae bacterium]|nr:sulfatase-like hydrolase/transferase [Lachnospiraceae bacterium]